MRTKPSWRNIEAKKKGSGTIAGIFVICLLLGFLLVGYVRSLHIGASSAESFRKSANTYIAILGSSPSTLFVFQKDTGKAALFTLDDQKRVLGGIGAQDLVKINDLKNESNGADLMNAMTLAFRAKVSNYVLFKNPQAATVEDIKGDLGKFTSYWTPFSILLGGVERGNIKDINITRLEAIRLWWQLKDVRTESIKITDLAGSNSEKLTADGKKVLGVDESFFNKSIQPMTENDDVISEHLKVTVSNPGRNRIISQLAAGFVNNTGADLREVNEEGALASKTVIFTDMASSKTARYLATIFDCDIKPLPETEPAGTLKVVLGTDFDKTYIK